ncbi:acetyl/propionyl/methylcrotonyl-CoA carboxylase subunit alpha [Chitinimonas sp. BJB300]|uniref:acetyl/propionyl/methylcrotonyl-CoA carboxylase subunit alpha n=1 Tax=Chitinimonas sp. BJB300 TaxID=1559339 RepID=UPI000C1151BB|nr:acetyl/propionyl/methylcrotonyl-CoA carboxylase subunit alpha [Chitinimonas sp. BJB300]PHV13212.1 3-methylcrotonyl-CoA carboxylase [Chitinimonas sp. BJB300]TSJ89604.1 acetyl/propionyl/methylcrotonyl-CoA carboxylase subunit alpha [Chitinimonas sp. BJB300]
MFKKILIANRGEIACRVIATARKLGIKTVAVYSDADAEARHVKLADEAIRLGPPAPRESYLRSDLILAIAKQTGAEAIHPGYGFLSENADFATACMEAGVVFIGPPASAISAMGSKSAAKTLMETASVPLVPGYHGDKQDLALLQREADKMGYPVLIKASAGGGGKGMKIVEKSADFTAQLASAQREAQSSFGDARVLIEKYLTKPRHIEIQVFADTHGDAVYLFERDCSVQRRHQKVLEEAPAPGMTTERRVEMGTAAVNAAKAIGYVGAGTVEFIFDTLTGAFYFMEMNTRLQVEHPVTEMITGQDLVEWQLRVASGESLPLKQHELKIHGHAFEARVYAEDPARDFLPQIGHLLHLRQPAENAHVRVDTGVESGDEISPWYDPMIAKLIVWDESRERALDRLAHALSEYEVVGLDTNLAFLRQLASHPAFAACELDTGFIARHHAVLIPPTPPVGTDTLAMAALAELAQVEAHNLTMRQRSSEPASPWWEADGWRLNQDNRHALHFRAGDQEYAVIAHYADTGYLLEIGNEKLDANGSLHGQQLRTVINGHRLQATVVRDGSRLTVVCNGTNTELDAFNPLLVGLQAAEATGGLNAPMPGTVVTVHVKVGDMVEKDTPLVILEAMKMEHTILAPQAGTVKEVFFEKGEQVTEGAALLEITPAIEAATITQ